MANQAPPAEVNDAGSPDLAPCMFCKGSQSPEWKDCVACYVKRNRKVRGQTSPPHASYGPVVTAHTTHPNCMTSETPSHSTSTRTHPCCSLPDACRDGSASSGEPPPPTLSGPADPAVNSRPPSTATSSSSATASSLPDQSESRGIYNGRSEECGPEEASKAANHPPQHPSMPLIDERSILEAIHVLGNPWLVELKKTVEVSTSKLSTQIQNFSEVFLLRLAQLDQRVSNLEKSNRDELTQLRQSLEQNIVANLMQRNRMLESHGEFEVVGASADFHEASRRDLRSRGAESSITPPALPSASQPPKPFKKPAKINLEPIMIADSRDPTGNTILLAGEVDHPMPKTAYVNALNKLRYGQQSAYHFVLSLLKHLFSAEYIASKAICNSESDQHEKLIDVLSTQAEMQFKNVSDLPDTCKVINKTELRAGILAKQRSALMKLNAERKQNKKRSSFNAAPARSATSTENSDTDEPMPTTSRARIADD